MGTFEPTIADEAATPAVRGRPDRLVVVGQGFTTGEISAHFADVYGATVFKDTVSASPTRCWRRWPIGGLASGARWVMRWKPVVNAFAVTFEGRIDPTTTN